MLLLADNSRQFGVIDKEQILFQLIHKVSYDFDEIMRIESAVLVISKKNVHVVTEFTIPISSRSNARIIEIGHKFAAHSLFELQPYVPTGRLLRLLSHEKELRGRI